MPGLEESGGDATARFGPLFYTRVQGIVQPRNADYQGNLPLLQGACDLGPGQGVRHDDRQPGRERGEHPDHERVDVVERQRQHDAVVVGQQVRLEQRVELEREVMVAQRYALGRAGGARSVEECRPVF
jgi:hypothetical protein